MLIKHRTQAGTATYTDEGIALRPRFGKQPLLLTWSNIDFISPTPGLRRTDTGWTDFQGRPVAQLSRLVIEPALRNRHLARGDSWWQRLWLRRFEPGVLLDADDQPAPQKGFLRIEVQLASLSVSRAAFFDFLTTHRRFDLIVHSW